jgi:hypothetical protein
MPCLWLQCKYLRNTGVLQRRHQTQLPVRVAGACSLLATAPRGSLLVACREGLLPAPWCCWSCWVRVRVQMGMMEDGNGGWSGMRMGVGLLGHVRLWLGCLMRCSPCDARERSSVFGFNGSSVQVEHKTETEAEHRSSRTQEPKPKTKEKPIFRFGLILAEKVSTLI